MIYQYYKNIWRITINQNNEILKEILLSLSDAISVMTQKAMDGLTAFASAFSEVLVE